MHRLPRSLCLAITFLASAGSHGQAQVRSAAPAWSTEYVTSPEASRPGRISITVFDPVRQELASSPARTLLGSTVGALAFGTFATANSFGSGDGTYLLPAAVAAGAGLGAVLGSAFSGREPAPLQTIVGAALGGLPLLVISGADGSGSALLLGMVFPVVGASLGNAFGQ